MEIKVSYNALKVQLSSTLEDLRNLYTNKQKGPPFVSSPFDPPSSADASFLYCVAKSIIFEVKREASAGEKEKEKAKEKS